MNTNKTSDKTDNTEKYEKIPLFSKIAFIVALICLIIYLVLIASEEFADFFNLHIASHFRAIISAVTAVFPFSVSEVLIVSSPIIAAIAIRYIIKYRSATPKATRVSLIIVLSSATLFFSLFVMTIAPGYYGKPLDEKLGFEKNTVSATDLYNTAEYLVNKINGYSNQVGYGSESFSKMPYKLSEMNKKLTSSFEEFSSKNTFIKAHKSKVKPILFSKALSYAHVTGAYTFFTGEANINTHFPDYTIPFTAAHELAHQRGISREDEANLIAFFICIGCNDRYIQYSGYLNMYEYVSSALYSADRKLFQKIDGMLSPQAKNELMAYGNFFDSHSGSPSAKVTEIVNDAYLKSQGTGGNISYGLVVDLTVAYYNHINNQE